MMRVRELIEALSQFDPDALVLVEGGDDMYAYAIAASAEAGEAVQVTVSQNVLGNWTNPKKHMRLAPVEVMSTGATRVELTGEPSQAVVMIRFGSVFI